MPGTHAIARYVCTGCSKEFFRPKRTGRNRSRKPFCSSPCWYEWVRGRRMAKYRQLRIRLTSRKHFTCKFCGKETDALPYVRSHYCSRKCYDEERNARPPYEFTCKGCGKVFAKARTAGVRLKSRKYCSRECATKYNVGANNPSWRGKRRLERGPTWRANSRLARERDNHQCARCGTASRKGQLVSVDHIVAYRLARGYAEQNPSLDPNDLINLISLCRGCHAVKTHKAETMLLRGNVMGFIQEAKIVIPLDRIYAALQFFGLHVPAKERA